MYKSENQNVVLVYKSKGETPLQALEKVRTKLSISNTIPMTYAGRLDPMAEGLLIVLIGEECKQKEKYLGLDKTYRAEILFGVSTDTFDMLGLVTKISISNLDINRVKNRLMELVGKHTMTYPPYSSKTVSGKPLFAYAREGTLDDIEIPKKEIEIKKIDFVSTQELSCNDVLKKVSEDIALVSGDFRQKDSMISWQKALERNQSEKFALVTFDCTVSSGTYVRWIAEELGKRIGMPACLFSLIRTSIGYFKL